MTDITIGNAEAIRLLEGAVSARGEDFVYDDAKHFGACLYEADGKPDCMVGQALFDAGVPIETLTALNEAGTIDRAEVIEILSQNGVTLTDSAVDIFTSAQRKQDDGKTWGYALMCAKGA